MSQGLLLTPGNTAETQASQRQAESRSTTVLGRPDSRRRVVRWHGPYTDTTNCAIWASGVLLSEPPATLCAALATRMTQQPGSVADLVAEVVEADLTPPTGARPNAPTGAPISKALCIAAAREIAPLIHAASGVRYAAFWNDEDQSTSLVIHSSTTKRQITFEFAASGRITCSKIDEHMQQTSVDFGVTGTEERREFVEWLKRRG